MPTGSGVGGIIGGVLDAILAIILIIIFLLLVVVIVHKQKRMQAEGIIIIYRAILSETGPPFSVDMHIIADVHAQCVMQERNVITANCHRQ